MQNPDDVGSDFAQEDSSGLFYLSAQSAALSLLLSLLKTTSHLTHPNFQCLIRGFYWLVYIWAFLFFNVTKDKKIIL